jgi:hypothetical protein
MGEARNLYSSRMGDMENKVIRHMGATNLRPWQTMRFVAEVTFYWPEVLTGTGAALGVEI